MDALSHRVLTLQLSKVDTGIMVSSKFRPWFYRNRSRPCTNCYSDNRIAQVHVVFKIPSNVIPSIFLSSTTIPSHLAYIEWFSPLSATPDNNSCMYKVSRLVHHGHRHAAIIPVERIICSVHLLPRFGPAVPHDWKSFSVLDQCNMFYVNPFSDRHNYLLFSRH